MTTDRMEQSRMMYERALIKASNLFNCNGVPMESNIIRHAQDVAYVANLFTIAAALRERAVEEAL